MKNENFKRQIFMKKFILIILALLMVLASCVVDRSPLATEEKPEISDSYDIPSWSYLGLSDKHVLRLRLFKPYLYACTGPDGLWRKNIESDISQWEFAGMSNDSLPRESPLGLTDVVAGKNNPDEMIIAYDTADPTEHHLFKTKDGGKSWFVSDSGLSYTLPPPHDEEIYYADPTLFCQTTQGVFALGGKVCYTENFGESWQILSGAPYLRDFTINRNFENILIGAGSGYFEEPFLFYSGDQGLTWDYSLIDISTPWPVLSIALDGENPDLIYISMWTAILRSDDFGVTFREIYASGAGTIRCLEEDFSRSGRLFASVGLQLLETVNFGKEWQLLETPNLAEIRAIVYDPEEKVLYFGTESGTAPFSGVYVFK